MTAGTSRKSRCSTTTNNNEGSWPSIYRESDYPAYPTVTTEYSR